MRIPGCCLLPITSFRNRGLVAPGSPMEQSFGMQIDTEMENNVVSRLKGRANGIGRTEAREFSIGANLRGLPMLRSPSFLNDFVDQTGTKRRFSMSQVVTRL